MDVKTGDEVKVDENMALSRKSRQLILPTPNIRLIFLIPRQRASIGICVTAKETQQTGKHQQPDVANFYNLNHGDKDKQNSFPRASKDNEPRLTSSQLGFHP